jgi:hypothetical protein
MEQSVRVVGGRVPPGDRILVETWGRSAVSLKAYLGAFLGLGYGYRN